MENASKALIMAGGVLIAVLIIGLFAYMFTSLSSSYETEENIKAAQEIEEYNKQYLSYNKKLLRGSEVLSLINKAISNNEKYAGIDGYQIEIYFILEDKLDGYTLEAIVDPNTHQKIRDEKGNIKYEVKTKGYTSLGKGQHNIEEAKIELLANNLKAEAVRKDFQRRVFDCINVETNNSGGRVSKMEFKEKRTNLNEGF